MSKEEQKPYMEMKAADVIPSNMQIAIKMHATIFTSVPLNTKPTHILSNVNRLEIKEQLVPALKYLSLVGFMMPS